MKTINNSQPQEIQLKDISISPFNYRYGGKPVDEESLKELAESIKTHGVIQSVLLRPLVDGKYELVAGERRFRASKLAGKKSIPATIRELTDEEVKEIQVIENLQREDPHPMAEAIGIQQLLSIKTRKSNVEEVAKRIGKSEAYVYQRLKLNSLNENFCEMFFANAINTSQALRIARLDSESQEDFFNSYCKEWKGENWTLHNFNTRIENYQLDLSDAKFDIKDAKLDKKAGACTKCPHNTAVTTSLFPEDSDEARCTNRPCYENKCRLFTQLQLAEIFKTNPDLPVAVADDTVIEKLFANDDTLIKGRTILINEVDFFEYYRMPEIPKREDFDYNDSEEENEAEYQDAVQEYDSEVLQNEHEVAEGNYRMAILLDEDGDSEIIYLDTRKDEPVKTFASSATKSDFKAKDYQEAAKGKTLTVEIIENEKERLLAREFRSKELDEIKLQENFYKKLEENEAAQSPQHPAGINDRAVAVFLQFDSLNYHWKRRFTDMVLDRVGSRSEEDDKLLQFFFNATENELSVLCRMALLNKADAKSPNSHAGQLLRLMVEGTPGMDAAELVNIQRTITKEREMKLEEKMAILNKQAEKL
jgi:ParB family chromosome partitioning protein